MDNLIKEKLQAVYDNSEQVKALNNELGNIIYGVDVDGKSHYDLFWDSFQDNGWSQEYNYGFYGGKWNDKNFKPKYEFKKIHSALSMFSWNKITELNIPMSFNTSPINLTSLFSQNTTIKKILLLTVNENVTYNSWFYNTTKLESVTFAGIIANNISFAQSTLLNKVSIENIFSCLSDTTTDKTLTVSQTAVNNAFEGGSTGTEWLNLVATKPNWTISLS